jgi:hypothetical protein
VPQLVRQRVGILQSRVRPAGSDRAVEIDRASSRVWRIPRGGCAETL